MLVRVWTVGFEGLERITGSVAYASMPNACLGPGYNQGARLRRIAILDPRGESSGCRGPGH